MAVKPQMPKLEVPQFDLKKLQSFDWRSLKKYTSSQSSEDLNRFLEAMPGNVGQTMLIIAAVAWGAAGALGLYVTVQLKQLTEVRAQLQEAEALKPIVPVISDEPIDTAAVTQFVESIKNIYRGVDIRVSGSSVQLNAKSTADFAQWREAVGHIQNGGSGWRVNVDHVCVGRECKSSPLSATLKINKVSVKNPSG